jgi:hypothetical protein
MADKIKDIPRKLLEGYLKKIETQEEIDSNLIRESIWSENWKEDLKLHLSLNSIQILERIRDLDELLEKIKQTTINMVNGELRAEMAEILINYSKTLDFISQEIGFEDVYVAYEVNDPVTGEVIPIQDEYLDIAIALRTAAIVFEDLVIGVLQKSQLTPETYDRVSNLYLKAANLFHTASEYSSLVTVQSVPEFLLPDHLEAHALCARAEAQHILAVKEDRAQNFQVAAQIYAGASILFTNASKLSLIENKSEEADGRSKFELGYSSNSMALATVNEDPCEAIGYWKRAIHHFETGSRLFPSDRIEEMTTTAVSLTTTIEQNLNIASKNCAGTPYSAEDVSDFEAKVIATEPQPIIQPKRGQYSQITEEPEEQLITTEEAIEVEEAVEDEEVVEVKEAIASKKEVAAKKLAERIELSAPLAEESLTVSGETGIVPIPGTRYAAQLIAKDGKYSLKVFGGSELLKEINLRSTGHYDIMGSIASSVSVTISPHILSKVALSLKKMLKQN